MKILGNYLFNIMAQSSEIKVMTSEFFINACAYYD